VLFVGSLVPVKNVPVLVGAFDRLRRQMSEPVELAIVGGGFLASSVRRELDRRGLGGTVRMVGPRAPAEVAAWLGASDVLCLPSRSEGVPNVVLEALACGRPVVASAVGGIPEVHPGAEAGDLVRPGDEEALAQALRSALSREWQPAELSRLVKDFTWEANARRVVGCFEAAGLVGEDLPP
jgi:glycosyltransferase involved in cell wall biosynthesis